MRRLSRSALLVSSPGLLLAGLSARERSVSIGHQEQAGTLRISSW